MSINVYVEKLTRKLRRRLNVGLWTILPRIYTLFEVYKFLTCKGVVHDTWMDGERSNLMISFYCEKMNCNTYIKAPLFRFFYNFN